MHAGLSMPDQTTGTPDGDLESQLAGFVRSYMHALGGDESSERQEALRWICAALERLLGRLLQEHGGGRYSFVDGIVPGWDMVPNPVQVLSPRELTIRGTADWGENARGSSWIEPFFASLRISLANRFYDIEVQIGIGLKANAQGRDSPILALARWILSHSTGFSSAIGIPLASNSRWVSSRYRSTSAL